MPIQISLKKSTANPTSSSGLTLGEPVFNYGNNTLWMGLGGTTTPAWIGAGVCGASGGIAAGLTYQIPTLGAVKDYFSAVSSAFLGTTASYVATFNGLTGAIQGVSAAVAGSYITVSAATGSVTITNTGVQTFNGLTGTIQGVSSWNGQTGAVSFVNYVSSFNGSTGAVQGVSSAAAGTGISISAATGAITITNTGVQTFNGLTGAVTGVTVGGANTFTALNSFNAGISSNGGTFSANTRFLSGIQTDSVLSTTGVGGTVYINSDSNGNGGNSITYIGDWNGTSNGISIIVDDQVAAINLNGNVGCSNTFTALDLVATRDFYFGGSAILSSETNALGTTAGNQIIGTVDVFNGSVDTNRSVEFFVQASHSSGYEALKIMVIHDGINTYNTQYGLIRTGPSLCSSYTTTIAAPGGNKVIRLRATPTNTNTTFKVVKTVIPA